MHLNAFYKECPVSRQNLDILPTRLLQNLFENFITTGTSSFDVRPIRSRRPRLLIRPSMDSRVHGVLFISATTTQSATARRCVKSTRITRWQWEEACWLARPPRHPFLHHPQQRVTQKFNSSGNCPRPMQAIQECATFHQFASVATDAVQHEYVSWPPERDRKSIDKLHLATNYHDVRHRT